MAIPTSNKPNHYHEGRMRVVYGILIGFLFGVPLLVHAISSNPFVPFQGGTGTSTLPIGSDQILIGGDTSGVYDIKRLIAGSNVTIATSSGKVIISASGSGGGIADPFTHPSVLQSATTSLMLFNGAASTTLFSALGISYFGATATTTIDKTGNIVIPSGSNLTVTGKSDGCATWATGVLNSTGVACGAGSGGIADPFTHPAAGQSATTSLMLLNGQASTTQLSAGLAYFGLTATSSFSGTGALTLVTPLLVGSGGTGRNTFTSSQLLYGNGTTAFSSVATSTLAVGASISSSGTLFAQVGGTDSTLSLNMANANSWTALQSFANASSSQLSTRLFWAGGTATTSISATGALTIGNITGVAANCLRADTNGLVSGTGSDCGSGSGGIADPFTHSTTLWGQPQSSATTSVMNFTAAFTIASTSLIISSTTGSQIALSDESTNGPWGIRTINQNLYFSTSTNSTITATTSNAALSIKGSSGAITSIQSSGTNSLFISTSTAGTAIFGVNTANTAGDIFSLATSTGTILFAVDRVGHIFATSSTPTLSSCGTTPSMTGGDNRGTVTTGATASGCTVTFGTAYSNVPSCVVSPQTGSVVNTFSYTVSASAITATETGLGGGKFDYVCMGN